MKKLLLILSVVLLITTVSQLNAQNLSLGPRIGLNLASTTNGTTSSDSKLGLVVGITSTYSINEKSGIGVDLGKVIL